MHDTVPSLLGDAAARSPDATWLTTGGTDVSFGAAERHSAAVGAALDRLGAAPGEIVVLAARNEPVDVLTWLGTATSGRVVLAVNPRSTVDELAGLLAQVRARILVASTDDEQLSTAATAAVARVDGCQLVDADELAAAPAPAGWAAPAVGPDDVAVLIPTSGTTGRSKLVAQTHRAYAWAADGFGWWLGLTPDDRLLTSLPVFHINAMAYSLLGSMALGASVALLPRFSASGFLDDVRRHRATQFNSIGSMLELLMLQPERADDADNPVRLCYTGPSPTRQRQLEVEARFGWRITCGYALSESPYGMVWPRDARPYGTLGRPRQHPELGHVNDARVVVDGDDGTRREVPDGEVGELELRNPVIMAGYHEMPDETARVVVDGWLRTGDLVVRDAEGWYTFVGRKKDVIRRRGENLSPLEVEEALASHPDVADAAVLAVASDLGEDDIKAFVLPVPGTSPDLGELRAHVAGQVARFKVPRYLELVDDLPRTATGRTAKHRLPTDRTRDEVDFEDRDRDRRQT